MLTLWELLTLGGEVIFWIAKWIFQALNYIEKIDQQ